MPTQNCNHCGKKLTMWNRSWENPGLCGGCYTRTTKIGAFVGGKESTASAQSHAPLPQASTPHTVPGADLPKKDEKYPGHLFWGFLGLPFGLAAVALVGGGGQTLMTLVNSSNTKLAYLVGIAAGYGALQSTCKWFMVKGAIRHYKYIADNDPSQFVSANIQSGLWLLDKGDAKQAIDFFNRALRVAPHNRDAIISLAAACVRMGDMKRTIEIIEPWLENNADYTGEEIAGTAWKNQGNQQKAISHFERCLSFSPDPVKRGPIEQYLVEQSHDLYETRLSKKGVSVIRSPKEIIELSKGGGFLLFTDKSGRGLLKCFEMDIFPAVETLAKQQDVAIGCADVSGSSELGSFLKAQKLQINGCLLFRNGEVLRDKKLPLQVESTVARDYIEVARRVLLFYETRLSRKGVSVIRSPKEIIPLSKERGLLLFTDKSGWGLLKCFEMEILPGVEDLAKQQDVVIGFADVSGSSELASFLKARKMHINGCLLFKNGEVLREKKLPLVVVENTMAEGYIKVANRVLQGTD